MQRVSTVRVVPGPSPDVVDGVLALADECVGHGLGLIVQARVSDPRCMSPDVTPVDLDPGLIVDLAQRVSGSTVFAGLREAESRAVLRLLKPNVYVETSHLDTPDALPRLVAEWGSARILFGTHAPLFPPLVAAWRVRAANARLAL
ncbi:hypothetical protein [Knoellia sinensis]|uniref:hypothetical protein n=1 Tax=Knoellia sinensis TaxID=136100 RepID=UPI0012EBF55B|nr:hypothetical protein [Knoellia sinensis]